ncbi:MAG TPA: protease modulator HflC [Bauldia sp.]|nr:protease modulator HflC [Bauldia sp.]
MRRGIFGGVGLVILIVIAIAVYLSIFIVSQTQQALVLRFGQVVREVADPGLYYKLPLIDNVVYFDKRILDLDSPPLEIIASDQKRLVVDAWGRYKIVNPLLFYQSVGSIEIADSRLSVLLNSAVRQVLGDATFIQLVRDKRAELMSRITTRVDREARGLGVQMVDVKIRRADLPEANSQAIYQRMQTEREQEATEIRAFGEQQARRIRAEADRTAVVIVAEAQKEAEQTRGKGEADRNRILAEAFNADPDFFAFYRSMQAYQEGLGNTDTRWVISPDSEFFRYFNSSDAAGMPPTADPAPAPPPAPVPAPATDAAPDEASSPDAAMTTTPAEPPATAAEAGDGATLPTADAPAAAGDAITIE